MGRAPHTRSGEHGEAVRRRLALLGEELAGLRTGPHPEPGGWEMPDSHTRIRGRPEPQRPVEPSSDLSPWPEDPDPELPETPSVPTPGRHAHGFDQRRTWIRPGLGRAPLAAVLALVAAALAGLCWWLLHTAARPSTPVEPSPLSSSRAERAESGVLATPGAGIGQASSPSGGQVTVDVEGKVRRPGIVVLDAGSRVIDAIKAAGGLRAGRHDASLNLARVLVDGEQILVGVPAPSVPGVAAGTAAPPAAGSLVNLNTADEAALEALPEVGPVTAQSILDWRTQNGAFTSVQELLEVDGIGEATLDQLMPYVTV